MTTNVNGNQEQNDEFVKNNDFLLEEYKTLREEITATKHRLFLINGIGITGIPYTLNWMQTETASKNSTDWKQEICTMSTLESVEIFVPFLIVAALVLFMSENRNLMRAGRYIHILNLLLPLNTRKEKLDDMLDGKIGLRRTKNKKHPIKDVLLNG